LPRGVGTRDVWHIRAFAHDDTDRNSPHDHSRTGAEGTGLLHGVEQGNRQHDDIDLFACKQALLNGADDSEIELDLVAGNRLKLWSGRLQYRLRSSAAQDAQVRSLGLEMTRPEGDQRCRDD
jgi:hypothetical protein